MTAVHYYLPDQVLVFGELLQEARFYACGVQWMYQKHTDDVEAVTCGNCIRALAAGVSKALRTTVDTGRLKVSYRAGKMRLVVKP